MRTADNNGAAILAVTDLLRRYYDGLYYCDPALFETVFHEQARYHTTSSGRHLHYDMTEYRAVIEQRTPPAQIWFSISSRLPRRPLSPRCRRSSPRSAWS